MVGEFIIMRPAEFKPLKDFYLSSNRVADGLTIKRILNEHSINPYETRIKDPDGRYVSQGIATADDGSPPIMQERLRRFRFELFELDWNYYMPVVSPKFPYAWRQLSNNLYIGQKEDIRKAAPFNYNEFIELGSVNNRQFLFYDPYALPRAYIASRCYPSKNIDESAKKMTDHEHFFLGDAYIEEMNDLEQMMCDNFHSEIKPVSIVFDAGGKIVLDVVRGPAVLILNDNYYPGWHAIDMATGRNLRIKPANITFKSLILPEERDYLIHFLYRPQWLYLSIGLIITSCFCILLLSWFYMRSRSKTELSVS